MLTQISDVIKLTLKNHPETRGSDKLLTLRVWQYLGFTLSPQKRAEFMQLPATETIRRVRQQFQAQGKYLPSGAVQKHRYHKSQIMQQNAPTASPQRLATLTQEKLV